MKKIMTVGLIMIAGSIVVVADADAMKLYDIKSGKIDYTIKGSGAIMGQKIQTVGKKRVIFDDYGARNLTEEVKVEKQTIMGQKKVNKTHTLVLLKDSAVYSADLGRKRIMRTENMAAAMGGSNMQQTGMEIMKKMGGKKTGTDKVLGYTCDVWELMGTKQCIYKGIPLKVETNIMGIKNTEIATKAEFDISLSKDDFKLPDFPVYDMYGKKLDKSQLSTIDKNSKVQASQNAKNMAEFGAAMAAAMQSAGVKSGETPTKAQEKKMENSMMNAMFPRMKKEMLAESKALEFAKVCLEKADTLKEANACEEKMDSMDSEPGDPEDKLQKWDAKTKKETLGFIDQTLKNMECAKKANSMQEMKQCMPVQ